MRITRRRLLQTLGPAFGTALLSGRARGGTQSARRFVFVVSDGGWDPLTAFAPVFGSDYVNMGEGAEPGRVGNIDFVDHADRPSVRSFLETWGDRTAIVNGVSVPSVSHDVCRMLAMTGSSGGDRADWPTLLGISTTPTTLPSLVLSGPSFPGEYGVASARAGSSAQLSNLLDTNIFWYSDTDVGILPRNVDARVDAALDARMASLSNKIGATNPLSVAFSDAHLRLKDLRQYRNVNFDYTWDQASRIELSVQALAAGLSRCVTLTSDGQYGVWDSHQDNDAVQSFAFELLFQGLAQLQALLESTNDPDGVPLSETTIIVAMSEMGRTPVYNGNAGRDHWPFTSVFLSGPGIVGDQVVSGLDEAGYGLGYDAAAGRPDAKGLALTPEHIGATLLALADVDPSVEIPNSPPIANILS